MATIDTFTKSSAGFNGSIQTLGLKAKVAMTPVEKLGDRSFAAPIYANLIERDRQHEFIWSR